MGKGKSKEQIEKKILIKEIAVFILLLFLFRSVYGTATQINNEFSYQNYISQQKIIINNLSINPEPESKKLIFPFYLYIILTLTLILIIDSAMSLVDLYYRKDAIEKNKNHDLLDSSSPLFPS